MPADNDVFDTRKNRLVHLTKKFDKCWFIESDVFKFRVNFPQVSKSEKIYISSI